MPHACQQTVGDMRGNQVEWEPLTLADAAVLLAVSPRTARRYDSGGYLDAVRCGTKTLRPTVESVRRLATAGPEENPPARHLDDQIDAKTEMRGK